MNLQISSFKVNSSSLMVVPFMAFLLLFVAAAMPFINPLTPRLNSDVLAFMGLGLFGWVTHTRLDVTGGRVVKGVNFVE
jgi:hypothetical protein